MYTQEDLIKDIVNRLLATSDTNLIHSLKKIIHPIKIVYNREPDLIECLSQYEPGKTICMYDHSTQTIHCPIKFDIDGDIMYQDTLAHLQEETNILTATLHVWFNKDEIKHSFLLDHSRNDKAYQMLYQMATKIVTQYYQHQLERN